MLTAAPPPRDHFVVFELHKFLAEVGAERDSYTALPGGGGEAKAVFAYNDRGSTVALAVTYTFGPDGALRSYAAWGRTSRYTQIDDHITALADGGFEVRRSGQPVVRSAPQGLAVVIPGYAPMLGQDLLVRAWSQHGRPATLTVERLRKLGCLEVKIYSSIDPALVAPIAQYAHAHGMRVVGHIPFGMTAYQAIDAGFDSISHQTSLVRSLGSPAPIQSSAELFRRLAAIDVGSPAFARLATALVTHHVAIDDTLSLSEQGRFTPEDNARREPGIATLPRELVATLGGIAPSEAAAGAAAFTKELAILGALHKRGVVFMAGTDINVPGHSVHREIELYVMAGFTPMEAIQAATIVPARFMHQDRDSGTVEPGKRADLVIVRGDPLVEISAIRRTQLVVARGRVYDSASLWKLVGFHPAP